MAWGLAGLMATSLAAFIWREITSKDGIKATIEVNRKETAATLDRITGQFRASIDAINVTLAGLSLTMGKLDATMAREYVSKPDLKEVKEELKQDLRDHIDNCPMKFQR